MSSADPIAALCPGGKAGDLIHYSSVIANHQPLAIISDYSELFTTSSVVKVHFSLIALLLFTLILSLFFIIAIVTLQMLIPLKSSTIFTTSRTAKP